MAARLAGSLQDGGDPNICGGRRQAAQPRAPEPRLRGRPYRQPHQGNPGAARHPWLQPEAQKAPERLEDLRTPEGEAIPPNTLAELQRDMERRRLILVQIQQIEEARLDRLKTAPKTRTNIMMLLLARVIGVGIETADMLVQEILSRNLRDRRAVARYSGLTGSPTKAATRADGPIGCGALRRAVVIAARQAGIAGVTLHNFRHGYATRLIERGANLAVVQILLGHGSIKTTTIYTHLTEPTPSLTSILDELMTGL